MNKGSFGFFTVEQIPFEIEDGRIGNRLFAQGGWREELAGSEERVHRPLAIGRDEDEAARGRGLAFAGGCVEIDSHRADVVAEDVAQLVLRHLPDDDGVRDHLAATASSLTPGGVYAVGLSLTPPGGSPPEEDVWEAARGGCRVLQVINWEPVGERVERAHVQLVVTRGEREEFISAGYDLRTYSADQWRRLVEASPLTTVASLDLRGRDRADRDLPYQIEILRR